MKHALLTIAQVMLATSKPGDFHDTVASVAMLVEHAKDSETASEALANLAMQLVDRDRDAKERTPESDERAYAWNFVHAMIGLLKVDNGVKTAFLPLYAYEAISNILEEPVQKVGTNQGNKQITRFYTENMAESNWYHVHHLIDLDARGGKNYSNVTIHQFGQGNDQSSVHLTHNEAEELLHVMLEARLDEAKNAHEWAEMKKRPPTKDDFDPFLDSDDLP